MSAQMEPGSDVPTKEVTSQNSRVIAEIRDRAKAEEHAPDAYSKGFPRVDPFRQADPFKNSTR
jgi:hypothetical protein